MKAMSLLSRLFSCHLFGIHEWTSADAQGQLHVVFDKAKAQADPLGHFHFTSRMWCKRCGHFSELNDDKSTAPVPSCAPWHKGPTPHPYPITDEG